MVPKSHGLDWWKEKGLATKPFARLQWYLYPTMVERGLRFELPYQERLQRIGAELGRRLHEHDMHWWDKQMAEYQALPAWKDFPALWEGIVTGAGAKAGDYPFWLLTARSMQYAWGGNVGVQMIQRGGRQRGRAPRRDHQHRRGGRARHRRRRPDRHRHAQAQRARLVPCCARASGPTRCC